MILLESFCCFLQVCVIDLAYKSGDMVKTRVVFDNQNKTRWLLAVITKVHEVRRSVDLVVMDAEKHQVVPVAVQVPMKNIKPQNKKGINNFRTLLWIVLS